MPPTIDNRTLARLGLPEDIRRAAVANPAPAGGHDPSAWLLALLEPLPAPAPLPAGPGAVIVVAGGREAAFALARQIAVDLGLDADALVVASIGYKGRAVPAERRITSAEAAAEQRRSWRRRPRPTVVVVDAPVGRAGDWARGVIDALEPTMVLGRGRRRPQAGGRLRLGRAARRVRRPRRHRRRHHRQPGGRAAVRHPDRPDRRPSGQRRSVDVAAGSPAGGLTRAPHPRGDRPPR